MAYQRGSTRESLSLAERLKAYFTGQAGSALAGRVAGNVITLALSGTGVGTLASRAIGFGVERGVDEALHTTTTTRRKGPARRGQGKGGASRVEPKRRSVRRTAKVAGKRTLSVAQRAFRDAARAAVKAGLKVGTHEMGKYIRDYIARRTS